ncbi:MAG: 23S rRNA (pseudouridine(1915)-N(3))-methyltransferase RlmH [Chromatiaceae bacterium]|nr:MAG: 23S rRNA (pseudouridine(1915)-N(3))-methyltransferase RlmH [Chromatiaceae bacterium]
MLIHLLSVGRRMPAWVEAGVAEYARRLPPDCALRLLEIEPARRGRGKASPAQVSRWQAEEGERLLRAVPAGALVVALDERGRAWSTVELSSQLADWLAGGRDVALLVGGADGLAAACLARAERRWSLSPLTFPHGLVRVILAEQLYRAWSILRGHPYHRGD